MNLLLPFVAPLLMASVFPATRCGASPDPPPMSLRSADGTTAELRLHTEDDHGKNTHLCQSSYSLQVTGPDRSTQQREDFTGNDDGWGRSIQFRLEGFAADDRKVIGLIAEQGREPMLQVFVYEPSSGVIKTADLQRAFAHRLSSACRAQLRVIGTDASGIVLSTDAEEGCPVRQKWSLALRETISGQSIDTKPRPLSRAARYATLDQGTR